MRHGAVRCRTMRRPLRILLNAATALSLVLCAATMAAWVRSYQARDLVWWSLANPRLQLKIETHRGGLCAKAITPLDEFSYVPDPGTGWVQFPARSYGQVFWRNIYSQTGFTIGYVKERGWGLDDEGVRYMACPYWFIMLLTAILPTAQLAGWRRRARRLRLRPGLCQHCGY